ncbi:MAG TPA: hypothetical protein VGW75_16995 [Solirubrobacteraceae bacterium]|jgi:hypothetical protein|nr:hypothetical protein [Solirubrobacteraceae bacterium]
MKLLVIATDPVDAAAVRGALPREDLDGAEVLVVSPAEQTSTLKFLMSDTDEAIGRAEDSAARTGEALRSEGAHVRTDTGDSQPLVAIQDALATFPADRILVFGDAALAERARAEFAVPVSAAP